MESEGKSSSSSSSVLTSSLFVPCVQQLVKDHSPTCVPPRYIRPDFQPLHHHLHLDEQVPVIDFQRLLDPHSMDSELSNLHLACINWGFFQLVNHGVSCSLLEKLKTEAQEFFNLPMEDKKKFWQYPEEGEGFGQLFVVSEDQKLDWCDIFYMVTQPVHLRKPHLFPNLPIPLRETMDNYSWEVRRLAIAILDQMGKVLKIKAEEMKEYCEELWQSMRINYYPPCPQPEKVIGLTPHSDGGFLTILLQLNDVEGLEIMKGGKWVSIKPLPNAFIINVGDMLEMITNGAYKSIMHRATVNSEKERMSIASFHSPRYECEVGPASSLISDKSPPQFKTVTVQQYYNALFSRQLHAKSILDTFRI